MDNKKIYTIQINGIEASIKQIDALNDSLQFLDKKIKELNEKNVSINATSSGDGGKTAQLQTQDKLLKQLRQSEQEIVDVQKEEYQQLLANKELATKLKDAAKERASAERLYVNEYANTMEGLKQELADIKKVMNTTDLGSDKFKELTTRANELTNKLKEIEESYGQFGRNVGNYKSAFDGMKKVSVTVGGVVREFNSARDASRQLEQEFKGMVISGKEGTKEYKELAEALHDFEMASKRAESAVNDLKASSKGMDDILDMFQSFGAMGQVTNGLSAVFGFDDTEIEKSIQKLVALQNVMQGIEKLRQQMNTQEGIGAVFARGNDKIDASMYKLKRLNVSMLGTGTSARIAAVGIKALSVAIKGVATLGFAVAIEAAVEAITKLIGNIKDWIKGDADLVKEEKLVEAEIDAVNNKLEERKNQLAKAYYHGIISQEEYFRGQLKETTKAINEQISALRQRASLEDGKLKDNFSSKSSDVDLSWGAGNVKPENLQQLTNLWKHYSEAVQESRDAMSKLADENGSIIDWFRSLIYTLDDTKDDLVEIGQVAINRFMADYEHAMETMQKDTKAGEKELAELKKQMNDNEMLRSIFMNLDQYIPDEGFKKRVQNIIDTIKGLQTELNDIDTRSLQQIIRSEQLKIDAMKDGAEKRAAQRALDKKKELDDATLTAQDRLNIEKKYQNRKDKEEKEAREKSLKKYKENNKKTEEAEKELNRLRIAQMKEGLNKVIAQLEEERRQKLAKIKSDGIMVGELELETNKYYDKKIEDARKEHAKKVEETYKQMWNSIYNINLENERKALEIAQRTAEQMRGKLEEYGKNQLMNQGISSYGVQGKSQLTQSTRDSLGIISANKNDQAVEDYKKLFDLMREYSTAENAMKNFTIKANNEIEKSDKELIKVKEEVAQKLKDLEWDSTFMNDDEYEQKKYEIEKILDIEEQRNKKLKESYESEKEILEINLNAKYKAYDDYNKKLDELYDTEEKQAIGNYTFNTLMEENYSKDLETMFRQRMTAVEAYWTTRISNEKISAEALYEQQKSLEEKEYQAQRRETMNQQDKLLDDAEKSHESGLTSAKEYEDEKERIATESTNKLLLLEKEHSIKMQEIEKQKNDVLKQTNTEYYENILQEFRDFQTSISNLESRQPVKNGFGIVNLKETNKNNRELLKSYEELARQLGEKRKQITEDYQNGVIDENIYKQSIREMDSFTADLGDKMDDVKHKLSLSGQIEMLTQDIDQYVQLVGQTINSVLDAVWSAQDGAYEREKERLEEQLDFVRDKYDKMSSLAEEYSNRIKETEGLIATAQGDARDALLDRYNAELQAERRAIMEKKKAAKEEEKLKAKADKLDKEQKEKQKQRDIIQALINTSMAVSMASVNHWPMPAIAMMAAAAIAGAAQVAAIASQHYASGGVIEGKSHAQGGVKVLGGRAEVEGGEFITNKVTTAKNVDLLEYINSKRKRININDLIEFYGGDSPIRKNIQSVRTRFADGGIVPTLRNDIAINDRLIQSIDNYANRPQVVQVVDIIDRMDSVKQTQVLAGLSV